MNKRVPWGFLTMIIDGAKRKFDLPASTIIQKNSIQEHVKRGNFRLIQQPGHISPLLEIEPYILHLIDQLAKMRAPLNVAQGLRLFNSLITGGPIRDSLDEWQQQYSSGFQTNRQEKSRTI